MAGFVVAAVKGDSYQLDEYVDFPALRENVKGQLTSMLTSQLASRETSGLEALGTALGMMIVDKVIDQLITPAGLGTLIRKGMPAET